MTAEKANGFTFVYRDFVSGADNRLGVDIVSGKNNLFPGVLDGFRGDDEVAMGDFIYGEPQPVN